MKFIICRYYISNFNVVFKSDIENTIKKPCDTSI